jgi:hypothetical protein
MISTVNPHHFSPLIREHITKEEKRPSSLARGRTERKFSHCHRECCFLTFMTKDGENLYVDPTINTSTKSGP